MQWFLCPLAKQRLLPTPTLFFSFVYVKEHLYMSFYVFSKPCSTLHNTSWHSTHSLMLYSYCCQNSDISFAVQQICFYVLWFHIRLMALYTVIRAAGLLFLQYICSSRHNHFCLVIFLFFYFPNFPYVETLLSWIRKLNTPTPFQT
jgi:hypothetical protein